MFHTLVIYGEGSCNAAAVVWVCHLAVGGVAVFDVVCYTVHVAAGVFRQHLFLAFIHQVVKVPRLAVAIVGGVFLWLIVVHGAIQRQGGCLYSGCWAHWP